MKKWMLLFLLFLPWAVWGQSSWPPPLILAADPSGACANGITAYNVLAGTGFFCSGNIWHPMGGTGTGSVTNFSSGNLSPLFTTSVATPTTTPVLSFAASNAAAFTLFGNNTASAAAPNFFSMDTLFGSCSASSSALTFNTTTHAFGCNTISGSGTVNSGTANHLAYYATSTNVVSSLATTTDDGTDFTNTSTNGVTAPAFHATGSADGKITLSGVSSGSAAISVPDAAGSTSTILLPTTDPTNGQVFTAGTPSGGSVQTSWTSPGGGDSTKTHFVPITSCVPAETTGAGNAFWSVFAMTAWDAGHWEFYNTGTNVSGDIFCTVRVPHNTAATPNAQIQLKWGINATTNNQVLQTCDANAADGVTMNPASLTCATAQTVTVPATAYLIKTTTFAVQSTVAADDLLIVKVHKDSTSTATSANMLLWGVWLEIDETL